LRESPVARGKGVVGSEEERGVEASYSGAGAWGEKRVLLQVISHSSREKEIPLVGGGGVDEKNSTVS